MTTMNAHDLLVAGRNHIDRYGWFAGAAGPAGEDQPRCTAAAIAQVLDQANVDGRLGVEQRFSLRNEALQALTNAIGLTSMSRVSVWNDMPGRTKEQVLAKYDEAIAATAPLPAVPRTKAEVLAKYDEAIADLKVPEEVLA